VETIQESFFKDSIETNALRETWIKRRKYAFFEDGRLGDEKDRKRQKSKKCEYSFNDSRRRENVTPIARLSVLDSYRIAGRESRISREKRKRREIDLLERLDDAIVWVEPLHALDERRVVHFRLARHDDAGADRLRLRLSARQDLQVSVRRLRVSCKKGAKWSSDERREKMDARETPRAILGDARHNFGVLRDLLDATRREERHRARYTPSLLREASED